MLTATIRDDNGQAVGIVVLKDKTFSSGKVGFFGQCKIEIGGQRFQCQAQAVKITKPGDGATEANE